jgi:hypothetical protein
LVEHLYRNNYGIIKLARETGAPFAITAGIRHGCPLSPLLFITAMDGLIRRIRGELPTVAVRMYADDAGLVLHSVSQQAGVLCRIFEQLRRAAQLRLNIPKCIAIPLGKLDEVSMGPLLAVSAPPWSGVQVANAGKYLGFVIGPGAGDSSWDGPLANLRQATQSWPWSGLGLFFSAHIWNIYLLPILLYVAQLCRPPQAVSEAVDEVMLRTSSGPFNRVSPANSNTSSS